MKEGSRSRAATAHGPATILRSVARTTSVFDCFVAERSALSLTAIARRIGLAKSTTSRLTKTLEALGYLVRLEDGRYLPSGRFGAVASVARSAQDVRDVARPCLERLAALSGECVALHALIGGERVCLEVINATASLVGLSRRGVKQPLGLGGASLVLMAFQERELLDKLLPRVARAIGCSRKELTSILANVRKQGYAASHGGGAFDISGIAAPVFDPAGHVRWCIAILVQKRLVRGRVASLARLVSDAAADLSVRLLP
jgi:IclR family KDG regulon transcriptional repressor